MAQRFAIDGNFTQSFVGTINLNAQACPSNDVDEFASLFYDLDTGTVCYITSSTDFCYEFFFDAERTQPIGKGGIGAIVPHQATPPEQSFQFVRDPINPDPLDNDVSDPTRNINITKYLIFDSGSINAGGLKNYLLQNTSSGSIKLSTTTQAIQANYTVQGTTGSFEDNKIIIGNTNTKTSFATGSFTVITTTSDTPFIQGEKVCVEILGSAGGSSTTYQTGSSTLTQLSNLVIKDFDADVFVTSDPVTGQLTLQFGTPAEPQNLVGSLFGFNTNRFNLVADAYNGKLSYDLNGTTFVSASLIDLTNGVGGNGTIVRTSTDGDGDISFSVFAGSDEPQVTGSRIFKCSLRVELEDGSEQDFESNEFSGSLDKILPTNPSLTVTGNNIQGGFYNAATNVDPPSTSSNSFGVHVGATGSITIRSGSGTANNWDNNGVGADNTTNGTGTDTLNFATSTDTDTSNFRKAYKSPLPQQSPQLFYTASRLIGSVRRFVYKFGAAPTASLLEGDVLDLKYLQDLGFQSSSNNNGFDENPVGDSFTIQGNSFDYHYLIVKDIQVTSTPVITVNNQQVTFPQVAHYEDIVGSTGYRVFRTGQQGSAAVEYTLTTA